MPTVGFLQITTNTTLDDTRKGYLRGLTDNGFKEGENFKFEHKSAEGDVYTAQLMAREFADRKVDVLGTTSSPALQSAIKASDEV